MNEVFDSSDSYDSDTNNSCSVHNSDNNHVYTDFIPCNNNFNYLKRILKKWYQKWKMRIQQELKK